MGAGFDSAAAGGLVAVTCATDTIGFGGSEAFGVDCAGVASTSGLASPRGVATRGACGLDGDSAAFFAAAGSVVKT